MTNFWGKLTKNMKQCVVSDKHWVNTVDDRQEVRKAETMLASVALLL